MSKKPTVLFVCVHNAGRSQMAAGFMRQLGGDRVEVLSAGQDIEFVRKVRDDIKGRVEALLSELLSA